jgi:hypothetical protein
VLAKGASSCYESRCYLKGLRIAAAGGFLKRFGTTISGAGGPHVGFREEPLAAAQYVAAAPASLAFAAELDAPVVVIASGASSALCVGAAVAVSPEEPVASLAAVAGLDVLAAVPVEGLSGTSLAPCVVAAV